MDSAPPEVTQHPTQPIARDFSPAKKYGLSDYLFQFITITAGVLIALLVNGFVELRDTRALLRQARATIAQEITVNKRELEIVLPSYSQHRDKFENAIKMADELLATKTTTVHKVDFGFELAEMSSAAWRTAERTGALSHMDYGEVQKYSMLYDFQDLFSAQQRKIVEHVVSAMAVLGPGFVPEKASPKDLEAFRLHLLELRGTLTLQEQLAQRLAEKYNEILK